MRRCPDVTALLWLTLAAALSTLPQSECRADVGVGAAPLPGADVLIDGTRETLDSKWTYWQGPRFASALPIKWQIVDDPVDGGTAVMTDDPVAAGGKYGTADIVTQKAYRDFRLHVEFLIAKPGGNSGVYLQNRYEIQVLDGDRTRHGMATVINETDSPYHAYNGVGAWNAYDIVFRAARFQDGRRVEKARVSMYFNGQLVHSNVEISKVWGGANSGIDGGNDNGFGITDTPGGLKLQCEGHDVRYRNTWIQELQLEQPNTDFQEPLAVAARIPATEQLQVLFNGRDLTGWEGDPRRWSVVNGMIRGGNSDQVDSSTYLFTTKSYRSFRLLLDVRQTVGPDYSTMHSAVAALGEPFTDAGNNRFGFRGHLMLFCHDWGIWDAHRRNRIVHAGPGPQVERRGEWNQLEILVVGDRIQMVANGTQVFDYRDRPEMLQGSPIGLQLHSNDRPQEYHFRHLLLTENPSETPVTLKAVRRSPQ